MARSTILQRSVINNQIDTAGSYDNTSSSLTATSVQGAIDEVETRVDTLEADTTDFTIETTPPTTLLKGTLNLVDVSSSSATFNPPTGAVEKDRFAVSDSTGNATTNNIVIDFITAGYNLHSSSQNYILDADNAYAEFIYINPAIGWIQK